MLKRAAILILTLVILINTIGFATAAESEIKILINNVYQNYDQKPVLINNTTMVPLRGIFETLGAKVTWDSATKTITAVKSGTTVKLTIGKNTATVNNKIITLAVPAQTIAGHTIVPLRFVSEALGATVKWDGTNRTVIILTKPTTTENISFTINFEPNLDIVEVTTAEELTILNNINEGLFRVGPNGEYQLAMAEDYEISDDGLTWTFLLRDANWSDGTPVTAEDFIYGLTRASESVYSFLIDEYIYEAIAVDSKTLVMGLNYPVSYFQSILVNPTFFPIKASFVEEVGINYGYQNGTLANGPFKVSYWEPNPEEPNPYITLVKNEHYWDAENVKTNQITLKITNDDQEKLDLYLNNQIDMYELNSLDRPNFQNNPTYQNQLYSRSNGISYYLYFNTQQQYLQNKNIRKAISWAINRQELINQYSINNGKPLTGLVPPQFSYSTQQDIRKENGDLVNYDLHSAKEYLTQGLKELNVNSLPSLKLLVSNSSRSLQNAEFLKKAVAEIGLKVEIESVYFSELLKKQKEGDFDLTINGWGPDYNHPMTYTELFFTGSSYNYSNWSDSKYDELLIQSYTANSLEESIRPLVDAEKYLIHEEAVISPLYYQEESFLVKPNLAGYQYQSIHPFSNWKWLYKQ